jgi:hypothetical protein
MRQVRRILTTDTQTEPRLVHSASTAISSLEVSVLAAFQFRGRAAGHPSVRAPAACQANRRSPTAAADQAVSVQKRNVAVLQLLVVTAQAAPAQDGRHSRIEVARCIARRVRYHRRERHAPKNAESSHSAFMPTPNWFPARTTLPFAMATSSSFSLCT